MEKEHQAKLGGPTPHSTGAAAHGDLSEPPAGEKGVDLLQLPPASAREMPGIKTNLAASPKREMGLFQVTLVGDAGRAPDLDEVEKLNRSGKGRAPLMTVIEALVARHGGTMGLEALAQQVEKYWNRPLPTSPYSKSEFIFLVVGDSDRVRIA